jgi:hypothetical protein
LLVCNGCMRLCNVLCFRQFTHNCQEKKKQPTPARKKVPPRVPPPKMHMAAGTPRWIWAVTEEIPAEFRGACRALTHSRPALAPSPCSRHFPRSGLSLFLCIFVAICHTSATLLGTLLSPLLHFLTPRSSPWRRTGPHPRSVPHHHPPLQALTHRCR